MKYHNHYFDDIYLHNVNLKYPLIDNQHMVVFPKRHDYVYDKNFPYRLKGFKNRLLTFLIHITLVVFAIPATKLMYGLKTKGKENIKKYKALTKSKAMISVANHTVASDFLMIASVRHKIPTIPMWREGAESNIGTLMRHAIDGIVIAHESLIGIVCAYKEMKQAILDGKWLHIYPEAASWPLYPCLRSFQPGTFNLAYETNMPVLPMAVKFREPKGIARLFKKYPSASLIIGEPLLINPNLEKELAIKDLNDRSFDSILKMLGFKSREHNNEIRQKIYDLQANK